jgi:fatty-acyl-CoA synthase
MRPIRSIADLRAVESEGFDAVCPQASPQKIIEASARRWSHATALHYIVGADDPSRDRRLSFVELRDDVLAAARAFRALGVTPGGSVAILANHTPTAQIALWGAQAAGKAAPMNPMLRPAHIAALLEASRAAVVVMMGVNCGASRGPSST